MKRIFLLLSVIVISTSGYSQFKAQEGDYSIGYELTGIYEIVAGNLFSSGLQFMHLYDPTNTGYGGILPEKVKGLVPQEILFGRYYLKNDVAVRVGIGVNSTSQTDEGEQSDSVSINQWDQTTKAFSYGFQAGIEKHFSSIELERLDPYVGAYGQMAGLSDIKYEFNQTYGTPTNNTTINENIVFPGGCAFGLMVLAGFNYFITPKFAVGAELGWGYKKTKLKGDYTLDRVTTTTGMSPVTYMESGSILNRMGGLRTTRSMDINLSMYFGCRNEERPLERF